MGTPKYLNFLDSLESIIVGLNTNQVKGVLGDSVNNNRVLTVSQVIRFLNSGSGPRGSFKLGRNLSNVYELLRGEIIACRITNRTDAVDINEFVDFYDLNVIGLGEFKGTISRTLLVS